MSEYCVVIPARMRSTRLPDKPLLDLGGKPMVVRVAERAHASHAARVVVATDDSRILDACTEHHIEAILTHADHQSGTDRVAEAVQLLGFSDEQIVVNVQGDEPLITPALIDQLAAALAADSAPMATVAHPLSSAADLFNPNIVKVVLNHAGRALYFSRAPIPYARDAFAQDPGVFPPDLPALRHCGIYAYRTAFLKHYHTLTPSPLECYEALEQLRVLWHGHAIAVIPLTDAPEAGVDTPSDLARVRQQF